MKTLLQFLLENGVDVDDAMNDVRNSLIYPEAGNWEIDVIPISWGIDGGVAPGALAVLTKSTSHPTVTNSVRYRDFSGAADNDLFFEWQLPYGMVISEGIFFQVEGWITNATTPPIHGETLKFQLQAYAIGDLEALGGASGSPITVTRSFVVGVVDSVEIEGAGTEYSVGDILTIDGGNSDATLRVTEVDDEGVVVSVEVVTGGTGYEGNSYETLHEGEYHDTNCSVYTNLTSDSQIGQYDRIVSGWSEKVTIGEIAAEKLVILKVLRDTTDTYTQVFGVGWLKIKYAKKSQQS